MSKKREIKNCTNFDIDDLVVSELSTVRLVKKVFGDNIYKMDSTERYIIGSLNGNSLYDIITDTDYKIINKIPFSEVDKDKNNYYASGGYYKLRFLLETNFEDIIKKDKSKQELFKRERYGENGYVTKIDIINIYNILNNIEVAKNDELTSKNYHYYILVQRIMELSNIISDKVEASEKETLNNKITELAQKYADYVILNYNDINKKPAIELEYRNKIINDMIALETTIKDVNEKSELSKALNKKISRRR